MDEAGVYKRDEGDRPVEHSPRGRYIRFDIRLGTGAYKTVYKAYDTDQGIDVAWNAIDIGVLPNTEKTRIIQEVQLLQKLEHKNIINFYGSWFSKEKNQVVFITEIMTSGTLKSYIKRVQFVKWKIIKRWCIQILEGLHYLHSQNPPVIHRDLKCDNIFINGNTGDLRIGDLGLSTQLAVHKNSRAQSVLGTPEFMAPELYDESYDEKVDIYAFGMCVLEMVTKEVPYSECINPAQIYKKVTAGIRPRGLQRIVSQAAKDFIELCLSRGNGLIDVSAEYLLDHPFLKAQDDDGEMVRCLEEDELELEIKQEQKRLAHVSEESFAEELNMESCSKGSDQSQVTDRRKMFPSLSLEPEELSTASGASSASALGGPGVNPIGSTESRNDIQAEEKSAGKHRMVDLAQTKPAAADLVAPTQQQPPVVAPALQPLVAPAAVAVTTPVLSPGVSASPEVDEPLSGKKDEDHHVNDFLDTMPESEIRIQNTRMNVMGGRGHRLELEDAEEYSEEEVASGESAEVGGQQQVEVNQEAVSALSAPSAPGGQQVEVTQNSLSAPLNVLVPSTAPGPAQRLPSEPVVDYSHLRRSSFQAPGDHLPVPVPQDRSTLDNNGFQSRPPSASSSTSSSTNVVNPSIRKRGRRHEIRAAKDPDNEHSILLNLRLMIDGKSKEIKFPFNLFTDSTHDVACELAVDVGIVEPDLEDIADSISFLVTEGKINNLPDVLEDVWEEAPEPHSFSSKPLPHVSKMNFVTKPGIPPQTMQVPSHLLSPAPSVLERGQTAPVYSLSEPAHSDVSATNHTVSIGGSLNSSQVSVTNSSADASSTAHREVPPAFVGDGSLVNSSSSTASYASSDVGRSPHHTAQLVHATSELGLHLDDNFPMQMDSWERGISLGSVSDPNFIRKVQGLEDHMKIARSAFDERDLNLVAAIRSEEEKHQREVERFRKKLEELNKQRQAIANPDQAQQNGDDLNADVDFGQVNGEESYQAPASSGLTGFTNNGVGGIDTLHSRSPSRMELMGVPLAAPTLTRAFSTGTRRPDDSAHADPATSYTNGNASLPGGSAFSAPSPSYVPTIEPSARNA
ncbi:Wnk protein kinase, partial [Globisporangium splendens]